jgi:hypothetical protein
MTSLPERTPKKTIVPSIVALLSNGRKQAFPLLTVDLQRARHNILKTKFFAMHFTVYPPLSTFQVIAFQNVLKYCMYFFFSRPGLQD